MGPDVAEPGRAAEVGSQNACAYMENSVGAACGRPSGRVEDASAYVRRARYPASCGPVIRRSGGYALRTAPARLKDASCSRPSQAARA